MLQAAAMEGEGSSDQGWTGSSGPTSFSSSVHSRYASMLVVLKFPYSIGCLPGVISKTKDVFIRIID